MNQTRHCQPRCSPSASRKPSTRTIPQRRQSPSLNHLTDPGLLSLSSSGLTQAFFLWRSPDKSSFHGCFVRSTPGKLLDTVTSSPFFKQESSRMQGWALRNWLSFGEPSSLSTISPGLSDPATRNTVEIISWSSIPPEALSWESQQISMDLDSILARASWRMSSHTSLTQRADFKRCILRLEKVVAIQGLAARMGKTGSTERRMTEHD